MLFRSHSLTLQSSAGTPAITATKPPAEPEAQAGERLLRRIDFELEPFRTPSDRRGAWQVVNTLGPVAMLWMLIGWIGHSPTLSEWLSGGLTKDLSEAMPLVQAMARPLLLLGPLTLLVLFSARTFALMHDCGHDSLFRSRWLNRVVGFLLGVINAIPQHPWARGHAFHHRHNGNWERYRGPAAVVTLEKYREMSPRQRWLYGLLRQPLMLLPGGFF